MSYNGWTNYETWIVKLWMDNEETTQYFFWRDVSFGVWNSAIETETATRSEHARHELAEVLKEEYEHELPELAGPYRDLVGAALTRVDWFQIADSLLDEQDDYISLERTIKHDLQDSR